jgi:ATP-dependent helicase/nuclease subunit A
MPSLQLVPKPVASAIPDAAARERALDITQSFIVEAPAGSGKTGLLIQRFLKLLASDSVDDPAQVVAITFTRKATAEMLDRVLAQLSAAAKKPGAPSQSALSIEVGSQAPRSFDETTRLLAQAVLARDAQLNWRLLDNPSRLNIRTIDSISSEIASALPILSGSGGAHSPAEDAAPLHAEAARRTVMLLGGEDVALTQALETLLLHRDGNLANCESLIASMLATRDQWGELVPLSRAQLDDHFLDEVILPKLDRALDDAICRALTRLTQLFAAPILARLSLLAAEMGDLPGYNGLVSPIALCAGRHAPPEAFAEHLERWRALAHLLITPSSKDWRAGLNVNHVRFMITPQHKLLVKQLIEDVRDTPGLCEALCDLSTLPPVQYPREQWPVTKALFRVLSRALAELQLVFAERGACDFAEVGLLARTALRNDSAIEDLSSATGLRLQHLLVDEMQDTSSGQYEFIQLLTRGWDARSQTVFLVGDPKQSIYLFRQARVERFLRTLHTARLGDLTVEILRLTANFRSQPELVDAFNHDFSLIFPGAPSQSAPSIEVGSQTAEVIFTPASSIRTGTGLRRWHADTLPYSADPAERTQLALNQRQAHARQIRQIIEQWHGKPLPPNREQPWKIAVLVRNRSHLGRIVDALKQPVPIPFRAVDIEPLAERPEILDLLALTRALLHPADRTAWLALLRSPWCGLALADLHRLAGADDRTFAEATLLERIRVGDAELSDDAVARLQPFWAVINVAMQQRGRQTVSQWVSRTWRAFDTPAFLDSESLANAERFFTLLDQLESSGGTLDLAHLEQKMAKLYASPSVAPGAVDLMTLHGAKGLEWDVVIVPELDRKGRNSSGTLLSWLETNPEGGSDDPSGDRLAAGILAPISGRGEATHALNRWMRHVESAREGAERKRLFYVACTRAREELHLFAAPKRTAKGEITRDSASLLAAAWPAAEPHFAAAGVPIAPPAKPAILLQLAATAQPRPRLLQRIPYLPLTDPLPSSLPPLPSSRFDRPEGSFTARAFGNAMHAFLEQLSTRIASGAPIALLREQLSSWRPRISAILRASGLAPAEIDRFTQNLLRGLTQTLNDPEGQWILAAHPQAASESALTSADSTFRLDRTFLAGSKPLSTGSDHLWIIDYKTATHGTGPNSASLETFLAGERQKYAPQLETYARALAATTPQPIRLALFYPLLPRLVWWQAAGPDPAAHS